MARPPVVNPLLTLVSPPQPRPAGAGGKSKKDIVEEHLEPRRARLVKTLGRLSSSEGFSRCAKASQVLVRVAMDENSAAPSYVPRDLFSMVPGIKLVAPWKGGYLAEVDSVGLKQLATRLSDARLSIAVSVDVSRVRKVSLLADELLEENYQAIWDRAPEVENGYRLFLGSPAPFATENARSELFEEILQGRPLLTRGERVGRIGFELSYGDRAPTVGREGGSISFRQQISSSQKSFLTFKCASVETLSRLVASGTIVKWEPVRPLAPTHTTGIRLPRSEPPLLGDVPTVGVIDGGLLPGRYDANVSWSETPLIPNSEAAREHGTHVASLIIEADRWGNGLNIPDLPCKIGVVQAVAAETSTTPFDQEAFLMHVSTAMARHRETRVWNISANLPEACDEFDVSSLAHELAKMARQYDNTVVISAGNRGNDPQVRLSSPADCEAGIVVSGRLHDSAGEVAGACPESRTGLGPESMLKPDLSWFSTHGLQGGSPLVGTSYAAPLVSRLAAHTWRHLRDPDSDLVKAVIMNVADLGAFSHELGFGSPNGSTPPWESPPGSVVLAWKGRLKTGAYYYWRDIAIPSEMIDRGFLVGQIRLTAILAPHVSMSGKGSYFSSRLQTGVQYEDTKGKSKRLIGSLPVETEEGLARSEDAKWQPTRCYEGRFVHRDDRVRLDGLQSVQLGPNRLRVYARCFERNTFSPGATEAAREREHDVAFVLSMTDLSEDPNTFDSFVQSMGNRVQSAVIDQTIIIEN